MTDAADRTRLVEATFERIWFERMEGLPILNPALRVEAVDLQRWNGHWLGMLVTPWMMGVLLLPDSPAAWVSMPPQQRRFVQFPFGNLAFLGGDEPGLGEYQTCSLFSPMDPFGSHAEARDTARASLVALLAPSTPPPPPSGATAPAPVAPAATVPSRRRFLRLGA